MSLVHPLMSQLKLWFTRLFKKDKAKGGVLEFGTELITSADGSIAGLLGASPGASTAPSIMIDLIERCFPDKLEGWKPGLRAMVPSYGRAVSDDPAFAAEVLQSTAATLSIAR